jgi:methylthioribulose-1-phosphate dehydratase
MSADFVDISQRLVEIGRRFDTRGWVLGTSGNFSVVVSREPLRLAITSSGMPKGDLTVDSILEIDAACAVVAVGAHGSGPSERVLTASRRPSAEARLHVEIAGVRGAGAVLHTHSMWSTVLSERFAAAGGVTIAGYEMLKGLEGVTTHEHREWIPVLENDQDTARLAARIGDTLREYPQAHALLLRRHGMYTWGETLPQAVRHVEIVEFLLEAVARIEGDTWPS